MKYLWTTLAILMLVAAATGILCYRLGSEPALHAAAKTGDAMAWLRADFHLTDRQFQEIRQLHEAYAPSCDEHCRMIQEATRVRNALQAAGGGDPAAAATADRELQQLRRTCETAITAHVHRVASLMSPEDGRRYLALVLPKIAAFDHRTAPDLAFRRAP